MDTVHTMLELVDAHELALQSSAPLSPSADPSDDLQPIMGLLVSALVDACQRSAEGLRATAQTRTEAPRRAATASAPKTASASTMYVINCLAAASHVLGQRRSAARWAEQLSRSADEHISQLVQGEVQSVLTAVGCADLLDRLRWYRQDAAGQPTEASAAAGLSGSPASDPSLGHARVVEGLRSFFTLISSPDALPEFNQIQACVRLHCAQHSNATMHRLAVRASLAFQTSPMRVRVKCSSRSWLSQGLHAMCVMMNRVSL